MTMLKTFLFMVLSAVIISLVAAIPVLFLWNILIPDIFESKEITYFQAYGLLLLFQLLNVKCEFKAK